MEVVFKVSKDIFWCKLSGIVKEIRMFGSKQEGKLTGVHTLFLQKIIQYFHNNHNTMLTVVAIINYD